MTEIQDCIKCDRTFEVTSDSGFHCVDCRKTTEQPVGLAYKPLPCKRCNGIHFTIDDAGLLRCNACDHQARFATTTERESVQPDERTAFEAWAKDHFMLLVAPLYNESLERYENLDMNLCWLGWKARSNKRESVQPFDSALRLAPLFNDLEEVKTEFSKHKPYEAAMVMVQNCIVDKCIAIVQKYVASFHKRESVQPVDCRSAFNNWYTEEYKIIPDIDSDMGIHFTRWKTWQAAWGASVPMRESGWQPIETAPKDGTEILLYYKDWCKDGVLVINGEWDDETWLHAFGNGDAQAWMPLSRIEGGQS